MNKPIVLFVFLVLFGLVGASPARAVGQSWWEFQAIDTMKYSRDLSRELLGDPIRLKEITESQIQAIAEAGATHAAIATPYDEEFLPVLKAWVAASRKYNLKVWFRGNWSGWEQWFDYSSINRQEHLKKTIAFVVGNSDLFEEGDYFSACPECENGGPGDPRENGDVKGHREFLIQEKEALTLAFHGLRKNVGVSLNSMNGDVAKMIMDKTTTQALGGIVTIDHYVKTPEQLNRDVSEIAEMSGGKVVLGEFGAPIPDIHGSMTEIEQAEWIDTAMALLARNQDLIGTSYWTNMGGKTALWDEDGEPKLAATVVRKYYMPKVVSGTVTGKLGRNIDRAKVESNHFNFQTREKGKYKLPYLAETDTVRIAAPGYHVTELTVAELLENPNPVLNLAVQNWWDALATSMIEWFKRLIT